MKKHLSIFTIIISLFAAQCLMAQKTPQQIDLRVFAPTPLVQQEPSAVAWACAYEALTIMYCKKFSITQPETNDYAFSPAFLYNQVVTDCSRGTTFNEVFEVMKTKGVCYYHQFHPITCAEKPSEEAQKAAIAYKIDNYQALFGKDATAKQKIEKCVAALADSIPVVVGMNMDKGFMNLKEGESFWKRDTIEYLGMSKHAMTLVGYDEAKKAFLVMNSWGTKWANGGYVWVSYEDFAAATMVAYIFEVKNFPPPARISAAKTQEILTNSLKKIENIHSFNSLNVQPTEALVMKMEMNVEGKQYSLYYNRVFINRLYQKYGENGIYFYVAHKIARFYQNQSENGLDSDVFAGKTLAKLGETLPKTLAILQESFADESPLVQQQRTESVTKGWKSVSN